MTLGLVEKETSLYFAKPQSVVVNRKTQSRNVRKKLCGSAVYNDWHRQQGLPVEVLRLELHTCMYKPERTLMRKTNLTSGHMRGELIKWWAVLAQISVAGKWQDS